MATIAASLARSQQLLDELWAVLEDNQQRLLNFTARLGLPPPPPLLARPPPLRHEPPPQPFAPKPFLHQIHSSPSKKRTYRHQKSATQMTPKRPSSTTPLRPKTSPKPAPKQPSKPASNNTHRHHKPDPETAFAPIEHRNCNNPHTNRVLPLNGEPNAAETREWRPPWRYRETGPNAIVRLEWRPPWPSKSVLEDKDVFQGGSIDTIQHMTHPFKLLPDPKEPVIAR